MRRILQVVGTFAILLGLLFAAQGSGIFPYPRSSFMIDQTPWIWRGAALVGLGLLLLVAARRTRR